MNGTRPVTSKFSVSYSYFELEEKNKGKFNTYLNYVVAVGYVESDTMFIHIESLPTYILFNMNYCVKNEYVKFPYQNPLFYVTYVQPFLWCCIQAYLGIYNKYDLFNRHPY